MLARGPAEILGRLADLPVAVGERPVERRVDLVALERRERQHGPAADVGSVRARRLPSAAGPGHAWSRHHVVLEVPGRVTAHAT